MIDEISGLQGPSDPKSRPVDPSRSGNQPDDKDAAKPSRLQEDSAQISPSAAEISRYRELVRLHQEAYGDGERSKKLEEIRQRIADGFYERPGTIDELAGRVLEDAVQDPGKAGDTSVVERRIRDDFYSRPQVVEKTADKILKEIWPHQTGTLTTEEDE